MTSSPFGDRLKKGLSDMYENHVAWGGFAFVAGILFFFAYRPDISLPAAFGATGLSALMTLGIRRRWKGTGVGALFFFLLGLTAILWRTHRIEAPPLSETQSGLILSGEITQIIPGKERRILLENITIENDRSLPDLKKVRLVVSDKTPLNVGDNLRVSATLYAPTVVSAAYARRVYYEALSALGRAYTIDVLQPARLTRFSEKLAHVRTVILNRLTAVLPPGQAVVAIPLILGEQSVVPDSVRDLYRRAGITHVLSVSGFHMVLVAGFLLFLFRKIGALWPALAMRFSLKKGAAVIALVGSFGYLMISGQQVPAVRSFIMISLVLLGILCDRQVVSLRSLVLALFGILLIRPEYILSISFQLSFIAVLVLVCFYEAFAHKEKALTLLQKILLSIGATSAVSLATMPFIIYHFGQMNPYGVLGNLITTALFSFLIMPCLFLGVLMMPLGLEAPFWQIAGWGLEGVSTLCTWVAALPYSEIEIAALSTQSLCLAALGIWMACLLKGRQRFWGIFLFFVACFWEKITL